MVNYYLGQYRGNHLRRLGLQPRENEVRIADAATKSPVWVALAWMKIHDANKFIDKLKENVDKYIQKTMKDFPPPPKK